MSKKIKAKKHELQKKEPKGVVVEGTVGDAYANAQFDVILDNAAVVRCIVAGRLRQHKIFIQPMDRVEVEIDPYTLTKGRIIWKIRR